MDICIDVSSISVSDTRAPFENTKNVAEFGESATAGLIPAGAMTGGYQCAL